jgi:hypothetical protein
MKTGFTRAYEPKPPADLRTQLIDLQSGGNNGGSAVT